MVRVITCIILLQIPVGGMIWLATGFYAPHQGSVWASIMLAQLLGAVQVPFYQLMWQK